MRKVLVLTSRTPLALVVVLALAGVTGCSDNEADAQEPGRFTRIDNFRIFDGDRRKEGYTLRDRETGNCYLWLWGGSGNGGPAITSIDCPDPEQEAP
tara:strand:- start:111701 stop:111991 length:291 start_codon:yes stop_codon:yes gene_type:complete